MLEIKVVDSAETRCDDPILFALKKNRSLRVFLDYPNLYAVTDCNFYRITRLNNCIDSLGDELIFSIIDANRQSWQIEIENTDQVSIAFTSHHKLYQLSCMPSVLRSARRTFHWAMDVTSSQCKWQFLLGYSANIIPFPQAAEEIIEHIFTVLLLLHNVTFTFKLSNCKFLEI